jgi:fructose-1,6-bisphosphatase
VGDFHRTMLYGGIYGYPGDVKNKNGKLRLLYECAPMSMIAEQVCAPHALCGPRALQQPSVPGTIH